MAWANGGGVTSEIHAEPSPGAPWGWRVSAAEVSQDGPFSIFDGVDRHLLIVQGEGVRLSMNGAPELRQDRDAPVLCFPGEIPVSSRLENGKVIDLNLMVRRTAYQGALRRVSITPGQRWTSSIGDRVVVVLEGAVTVDAQRLSELDAILLPDEKCALSLQCEQAARLAVATVVPL